MVNARYVSIAGIALSVVILAFIVSVFRIDPAVILRINGFFLVTAIAVAILRLLAQGLRFNYIIRTFSEREFPFVESLVVRLASEFVAMTTAAYVGGEVARAAWLSKKGENSGKALWLPYIEIIFDVFSANLIAFVAGAYALWMDHSFIGGLLLLLSSFTLILITAVVIVSRKGKIRVPRIIFGPLKRLMGHSRAESLMAKGDALMAEFCAAADSTLVRPNAKKIVWVSAYTLLVVILTAATLWLIALGLDLELSLVSAALLVYASIVLGNLPITLGGSGVAEAGVYVYASQVLQLASWPMVFAWRIVSYHVPLLVTGVSAFLILSRYTRQK